jgi:hypothetical protein
MPEVTATALRAARDAAHAATLALAQVSAASLVQAADGQGSIYRPTKNEAPDALCRMSAPGDSAYFLADEAGDCVYLTLSGLTLAAWEQSGARLGMSDECRHDEVCECVTPLPSLAALAASAEPLDIVFRDGSERGTAHQQFGRIDVILYGESVHLAYELVRLRTA